VHGFLDETVGSILCIKSYKNKIKNRSLVSPAEILNLMWKREKDEIERKTPAHPRASAALLTYIV